MLARVEIWPKSPVSSFHFSYKSSVQGGEQLIYSLFPCFSNRVDLFPGLGDVSGSFYEAIMNSSDVLTSHRLYY